MRVSEKLREWKRELEKRESEERSNPLSQYSTSQLKAELRQRKNR